MKLTPTQQEKITSAIQAVLGVVIIGLSVRESAKLQTAQAEKLAKQDARRQNKLQNMKFKQDKKLLQQKYQTKIKKAKLRRKKKK